MQRRSRRILAALGALLLAPVLALVVASFLVPLPTELAEGRPPSTGTVLRDRHGVVIRELLADVSAANVEDFAQRPLVELGARRQALIHDRREDVRVDVVEARDLGPVAGIAEADEAAGMRCFGHDADNLCARLRAINPYY